MALEVTYDPETGTNNFKSDGHVVYVGPHIDGHVTLSDGTRVNVTPHVVEAESPEHAAEIAHEVAKRLQNEGHPLHDADTPFTYQQQPGGESAPAQPTAVTAPAASSTEV
jgi:hypothetical protein